MRPSRNITTDTQIKHGSCRWRILDLLSRHPDGLPSAGVFLSLHRDDGWHMSRISVNQTLSQMALGGVASTAREQCPCCGRLNTVYRITRAGLHILNGG